MQIQTLQFQGRDRRTNPALAHLQAGDQVTLFQETFGKPSTVKGFTNLTVKTIRGHEGEAVDGHSVPAATLHDGVDKVTLVDAKGQEKTLLLGSYIAKDKTVYFEYLDDKGQPVAQVDQYAPFVTSELKLKRDGAELAGFMRIVQQEGAAVEMKDGFEAPVKGSKPGTPDDPFEALKGGIKGGIKFPGLPDLDALKGMLGQLTGGLDLESLMKQLEGQGIDPKMLDVLKNNPTSPENRARIMELLGSLGMPEKMEELMADMRQRFPNGPDGQPHPILAMLEKLLPKKPPQG